MKVQSLKMLLLKVDKREGVGKISKKPYLFYQASLVDDDSNVFSLNLSDEIDTEKLSSLLSMRNKDVVVSVEFYPKGFDIGARLIAIKY